jgi:membrane protein YqaA with SNARE-associated domain
VILFIAAAWGVGEATLFFIVPDVYLTYVALSDVRRALVGCAAAVIGALMGGAIMFRWGHRDHDAAVRRLTQIPGVRHADIRQVRQALQQGWRGLFAGGLTGTPYKIYAVESGSLEKDPATFLLMSMGARASRFVLLVAVASWSSTNLLESWPIENRRIALLVVWTGVYVVYFVTKRKPST